MTAELSRDIALEAGRRCAGINPHELWAALDVVETLHPRLIVDIRSEPAVWWAWWSTGAELVALADRDPAPEDGFTGDRWPTSVSVVVGDPRQPVPYGRVGDLIGGRAVDVLVLGGRDTEHGIRADYQRFAPMVRPGGLVLVRGIANFRYPGVRRFWAGLRPCGGKELVGSVDPDGYGLVHVHGREAATHG